MKTKIAFISAFLLLIGISLASTAGKSRGIYKGFKEYRNITVTPHGYKKIS